MRKLYWRPQGIPRAVLVLVALASVLGMAGVEFLLKREQQPHLEAKLQAAELALEAMNILKAARLEMGFPIDPDLDPAESGMLGYASTPVTTVISTLEVKRTTVNPNFAAVILEMLLAAGVREGDVVAVGASGSFPALNVCTYAAMRSLRVNPIIIPSASASQYGANIPELLWIDMERILHEYDRERFPYRSVAASLGGVEDRALGMSEEGRGLLIQAIDRNMLQLIDARSPYESIYQRMDIFARYSGGEPVRAYINIGGGMVSVGTAEDKRAVGPGLTLFAEPGVQYVDSVLARFVSRGVPVINLVQIEWLANEYGLPIAPAAIPPPGEGYAFYREGYNPWLAGSVLLVIVLGMFALIRSELGHRIFQTTDRKTDSVHREPMV